MVIYGDFQDVFVVGPSFRAEDSYTPRHLCEYTGLDVEKEINESYYEVKDIVDNLFVEMFDKLNDICQKELGAIGTTSLLCENGCQYPIKICLFTL